MEVAISNTPQRYYASFHLFKSIDKCNAPEMSNIATILSIKLRPQFAKRSATWVCPEDRYEHFEFRAKGALGKVPCERCGTWHPKKGVMVGPNSGHGLVWSKDSLISRNHQINEIFSFVLCF